MEGKELVLQHARSARTPQLDPLCRICLLSGLKRPPKSIFFITETTIPVRLYIIFSSFVLPLLLQINGSHW